MWGQQQQTTYFVVREERDGVGWEDADGSVSNG